MPEELAAGLVDTVVAANSDDTSDVVAATIAALVEAEEQESLAIVDALQRGVKTGGLAVIGPEGSVEALQRGQADVLVLAKGMLDVRLKEELVRLAGQSECQVEIVNHSDFLMGIGGAGCLLRYLTPEQYADQ